MTRTTTLRLRRIRFKDGRTVEIFRAPNREPAMRREIDHIIANHIEGDCMIDGFAFIVWDKDGASTCVAKSAHFLNGLLIPDFVRERLMAEKIVEWAQK